jgi:uncharacterized protein (TIGR02391 family)
MSEGSKYASLAPSQAAEGLEIFKRRLAEIEDLRTPNDPDSRDRAADTIIAKVNTSYREVFGADTLQAREGTIPKHRFILGVPQLIPEARLWASFNAGLEKTRTQIQTTIDLLQERVTLGGHSPEQRALRAYSDLDLHPEIGRAATELYRGGHYANAIENAVKALNALVRLRSDLELDGDSLMTRAFGGKTPRLRFNELNDESDQNEQRGFTMMFQGAVAGLRNPRAHKLIEDDPERALEFIAYISLLAKLLDGATKAPPGP